MRTATVLLALAAFSPSLQAAGPCARSLARLSVDDLDALFRAAPVGETPVGLGRGRVLMRTGNALQKARAKTDNLMWKGKFFNGDGTFTNQWLGFRAVTATVVLGTSWLDGAPCLVMEYPPDAKVFSNARDELREIAPGVWLGRFYERCPCPKHAGYFVLEMTCGR